MISAVSFKVRVDYFAVCVLTCSTILSFPRPSALDMIEPSSSELGTVPTAEMFAHLEVTACCWVDSS